MARQLRQAMESANAELVAGMRAQVPPATRALTVAGVGAQKINRANDNRASAYVFA